ncbi:MAG TPA: SNG1 family protein [Candidatus Corynebacterium avicola]|uniref:SNG1 family protein n=1 Tax=Candidatus Corynebacterium avicola TaxID=2838527 RepID=A0A9D1RNW6_9CORY|nr:SNG1 family protein [Candidatus Corynebacterium avicola]
MTDTPRQDDADGTTPGGTTAENASDAATGAVADAATDASATVADGAADAAGGAAGAAADAADGAPEIAPVADAKRPPNVVVKLIAIVLGLTAAVSLMLFAFLTPQYSSGPENLPLTVAGPEEAVTGITQALEQQQPGAFDITTAADDAAAQDAVKNRDAIGAISMTEQGATFYAASGAGQPYPQILSSMASGLQMQGMQVQMDDLAPTTQEDPSSAGLTSLALPLAFGGIISAVVLTKVFKKRYAVRFIGSIAFSLLAGLAIGAMLQFGYGTFDGHYLATSGVLALGIAATSVFIIGLEALFGLAGLGVGALLTILVSNPLSGISTGWQWLPSPWGAIGQFLPIGAAGDSARSIAFFDGAGIGKAIWVLLAWEVVGIVLLGAAALKERRKNTAATASTGEGAAGIEGAEGTEGAEAGEDAGSAELAEATANAAAGESTEASGANNDAGDTKGTGPSS